MRVCLIQFDLSWHEPQSNRAKVDLLLQNLELETGTVVVLPEMFTTGFSMQGGDLAESMTGDTLSWLKERSHDLQCHIAGSLIIRDDIGLYNRLVWVSNGVLIGQYDKKHLFGKAGEDKSYQPGTKNVMISAGGWKWRPLICYDLRFPVWSRNVDGYDALLYVANWPSVRREAWRQLLIARAIENQCYVVAVNRTGADPNDLEYVGDSLVIDPYGAIVADLGNKEIAQVVSLDKQRLDTCRSRLPFLRDRDHFQLL